MNGWNRETTVGDSSGWPTIYLEATDKTAKKTLPLNTTIRDGQSRVLSSKLLGLILTLMGGV
jgi:hypothetical protein